MYCICLYILRCHIHFDYFQIELYDARDPNGCLKMCDCIICIAGILLLTDMKAWRNFEILGFGLQDVKSNEPEAESG